MATNTKKSENQKIPKLRFPGFSGEWEEKMLGEISDVSKLAGYEFTEHVVYKDTGNIIALRGLNIKNNRLILDDVKYIDKSNFSKLKRSKLYINDIMFTYIGTIGEVALIPEDDKYYLAPNVSRIRTNDNICPHYVLYYFNLSRFRNNEIEKYISSSSQPALTMANVRKFRIMMPSSPEQQKIADFLGAVDEWTENLRRQKEELEAYKKGVMQKIFSQEIRFKDDDGNDFPEWERRRLGELGKFKSGQGFSDAEQGGASGIPFYKVSDMNKTGNEVSMTSANHYVTDEQIIRLKYKVIEEKSIIFAKVGAAIFLERKRIAQNFIIDNNMMAFIPNGNIEFIKYIFEKTRLSKFAQIGALPSYNESDLSILKTEMPSSEDEQQMIAEFLTSLDNLINSKQQQIIQAVEWKKGLMQGLFI